MRSETRVVIVGGGVMGVGLLYHLAHEGWTDVVLIDKGELTSGSTWHAAGLVPHFIGSFNMAKIHAYGAELYQRLEGETGLSTGWHGCGALRLATNDDEVDWFHYVAGLLTAAGVECRLIGPDEAARLHPLIDTEDVLLAAHTPGDGWVDPSGAVNPMAAAARRLGAEIVRHNRVLDIEGLPDGRWRVVTEQGPVVAEHVVNAAGSFGSQVGAMVGLELPIVNMVHQYLVTDAIPAVASLDREPPVLRDPRASCYFRQEQDGLIIGPYERNDSQAWGLEGIEWGFDFELLPPSLDRLEPWLELAARRIPAFAEAGIKTVVSGPITHTPDATFLLGPAPGLRNFWLCVGASIGITQGPGAGKYLAQWMVHGQTEINMREFDPRRYGPYAAGPYALEKSLDEYHHMYAVVLPGEYREAGRPVKTSPIYPRLVERGAVFAETFGWERPKWFAPNGEPEVYSYRRSNAFDPVGDECRAVRQGVGVIDLTAFSKYDVRGRDAAHFLDRICANRIPDRPGGIRLAHMLTELGGIESEATITRLDGDRFFVLSAIIAQQHDLDWLQQHRRPGEQVEIADVTEQYGALAVAGPHARRLLEGLTDQDLGNEAFPWLQGREITVAGIPTRALRVSYVGELGWELYHPIDRMTELYGAVQEAGVEHGLVDFGLYAMNSMRLEKAYKAWGAELTTEITMIEADMERFVDFDKTFIGRQATLARRARGVSTQVVYLEVDAADADPMGNEAVYDGERLIGITTSGAFGHTVGTSLAFAYVEPAYTAPGAEMDVIVLGERRPARVLAEPAFDPKNERLRA